MHFLKICAICVTLTACSVAETVQELRTSLRASEFNNVAEQYLSKATDVTASTMFDGTTVLRINMDDYELTLNTVTGEDVGQTVWFSSEHTTQYLAHISKYYEWEKLAKSEGDELTKQIGTAPSGFMNGTITFTFHSGNKYNHLLSIQDCNMRDCQEVFFDKENVTELEHLIKILATGDFSSFDVNDKYR